MPYHRGLRIYPIHAPNRIEADHPIVDGVRAAPRFGFFSGCVSIHAAVPCQIGRYRTSGTQRRLALRRSTHTT